MFIPQYTISPLSHVQASHIFKDSDVIMLCETRLSPHDLDTDYKMNTFADVVCHDERTGNES